MNKTGKSARLALSSWVKLLLPPVVASIVMFVIGQFVANGFLSIRNISSILLSTSILGLMTVAQNTVIIAGDNGIDLSIGAIASLTAVIYKRQPMDTTFGVILGFIAGMIIGAVFGVINGIGTKLIRIPVSYTTLIMADVIAGFTMFLTRGQPPAHVSKTLLDMCRVLVQPIRLITLIGFFIVAFAEFMLYRSRFGRQLRLAGDNSLAAHICGINEKLIGISAYMISGIMAGLVGLLLVSYNGGTTLSMGNSYTLLSVAAIAIGGTNLAGGKGSYVAGVMGGMVMIILNNILQAFNIIQGLRAVIQGVILLIFMFANTHSDVFRRRAHQ